ncbi:MAG TPA: DUF6754 domain-containing protein [Anaerolineae bacterium]|nr:DUF6754 domain-containing protein [Anaerolineae bacterium]
MIIPSVVSLIGTLFIGVLLFHLRQRIKENGTADIEADLKPLPQFNTLTNQVGRMIESRQPLHISLGRGRLIGPSSPASIAALNILNHLTEHSKPGHTLPAVTTGDASLIPAAQDTVRQNFASIPQVVTGQLSQHHELATFAADSDYPTAYAAAITQTIHQQKTVNNILLGHYGSEIGLMTAAGQQAEIPQFVATDDPTALAIAHAFTQDTLIGEDLLAATAYLDKEPAHLASLQVQDYMRWFICALIFITALFKWIVN